MFVVRLLRCRASRLPGHVRVTIDRPRDGIVHLIIQAAAPPDDDVYAIIEAGRFQSGSLILS